MPNQIWLKNINIFFLGYENAKDLQPVQTFCWANSLDKDREFL